MLKPSPQGGMGLRVQVESGQRSDCQLRDAAPHNAAVILTL